MKAIKYIFILGILTELFGCGCTDSPNASNGAKQINKSYDKADDQLAKRFDEQLQQLNEVMQYEQNIHTQLSHLVIFEIDSIVQLENVNFELAKKRNILKIDK